MVNSFSALMRQESSDHGPEQETAEQDGSLPSKPKETHGYTVYIFVLCVLWYAVSSGSNIVGKLLLTEFRFPCSIALFHLVSLSIFVSPFVCSSRRQSTTSTSSSGDHNELTSTSSPTSASFSARCWLTFIVPLAAGKFLSSYLSLISIANIPVSFSSTGESVCLSVCLYVCLSASPTSPCPSPAPVS